MKTTLIQTSSRRLEFRPAKRCLALLGAALIFMAVPASVHAALVAYDNFDTPVGSNSTLTSRTISRGSWSGTYQSGTQIFGVTDRTEALSESANNLVDTSVADGFDFYGLLKTSDTSNVFAVERPQAGFSATWEFDISKVVTNDLSVGIDFAAMGNWINFDNPFTFTASFDGGAAIPMFDFSYEDGSSQTYVMESGFQVNDSNGLTINDTLVNNDFQRLYADISKTGAAADTLTLTFNASLLLTEPSVKVLAFDNIEVQSPVPVPGTIWLLGAGFLGFIGVRRRIQN